MSCAAISSYPLSVESYTQQEEKENEEKFEVGQAASWLETQLVRNLRTSLLPANLSLMYDQPLHIVRGSGCYLFDNKGTAYLDGVNNVPHVGHSNPKVAKADPKVAQNNPNVTLK